MARRYFTGFSTQDSHLTRQRVVYDLELIKRDLLNHFHTRVGERVMRPTWGCRIWDWIMDPLTPQVRDQIAAEATAICEADARLVVLEVQVTELPRSVQVEIVLDYQPYNVISTFALDFATRQDASWDMGSN